MNELIPRQELEFQLYEVLDTQNLCERLRFREHSRETFSAMLDTAERIATDRFANHNALSDREEPVFEGGKVSMRPEVKAGFDAYREAGFIGGRYDFEEGGLQLPETVMTACSGYFMAANPATAGYPFLTTAAANVIRSFASEDLKAAYLPRMLSGAFTGTMALTEPHAGSGLADIRTRALATEGNHYLIKGSKIYISGGEHELSENIVHLVLARMEGAPPGVKGISLFVVPRYRLRANGEPGERNDVTLAGLIHKLGYRGTTSTALTFGDNDDCHGYLVGEPHQGLRYMFQMMNEARLGVGFGAAMIGYRGYQLSLAYARDRKQGRAWNAPQPTDPMVPIIQHGDIKRLLLAQKAWTEGAMALCFYGARLVDDSHTLPDLDAREEAGELLDLLTPVIKAWPSEYGTRANDLAIQVLGGAGYTREYPVEQCWRDNRLNPIHEGTNGIQALDLTTRKLWQKHSRGLQILQQRMLLDFRSASGETRELAIRTGEYLKAFEAVLPRIGQDLQQQTPNALANAHSVLTAFGHILVAWMWLRQATAAETALANAPEGKRAAFYRGKLQAARYFIGHELPLIQRDLDILGRSDAVCASMSEDWF